MELIFVSGKYGGKTKEETIRNIVCADVAAAKLWRRGFAVFSPHLNTALFDWDYPDIPREVYLEGDLEILKRCDSIYMLKGFKQSEGAMAELRLALKLGLKVYYEEADNEIDKVA